MRTKVPRIRRRARSRRLGVGMKGTARIITGRMFVVSMASMMALWVARPNADWHHSMRDI
jgi:hypothetical protein